MSFDLAVDLRSAVPVYEQIRSRIAGLVLSGALRPGDRLPSVRALAADLGIAGGTVARAFSELESAGVVHTRRRTGTVIADRDRPPLPPEVHHAATAFAATAVTAGLETEAALEMVRAALHRAGNGAARSTAQ